MELRPGYKQTEMGIIPEDWEIIHLSEVATVVRGGSPRPAGDPRYFNGNFIPWLTVAALTNIPDSEIYVSETVGHLTEEGSKHSRTLEKTTLIIANSGATLGVAKILKITCCANDGIAALVNQKEGDRRFICHYLNTQTKHLRAVVATGNGQPNLNTKLIGEIPIPFPPLPEQRAIAGALSDVDALIGVLDQLIAKKRDLKQAAMQQLLTGQTRLPGFSGEWEDKTLGELASAEKGSQLHNSETSVSGQFAHLNGGMMPSGYADKSNAPANTIAISEGGNSCGYVQFMTEPFWCGGHCYAVTPKQVDKRFLYHLLKSQQLLIMGLRVGSGLPNVQKTALLAFKLRKPVVPTEQTAIAAVLSDMDTEIAALEARCYKTRALKQGMMQELLTGRTRLV
jgi:type I restriction enzyme S subunit